MRPRVLTSGGSRQLCRRTRCDSTATTPTRQDKTVISLPSQVGRRARNGNNEKPEDRNRFRKSSRRTRGYRAIWKQLIRSGKLTLSTSILAPPGRNSMILLLPNSSSVSEKFSDSSFTSPCISNQGTQNSSAESVLRIEAKESGKRMQKADWKT